MGRYEEQLGDAGPRFARLMDRIPLQHTPPLAPDWLRCEMLERHQLLKSARIRAGSRIVEVGSGPHAIATVPLAFELGARGRLIAVERARWTKFRTISKASGLDRRIWPLAGDARRLPLRNDSADLAVCVHGVRSLANEETMVEVFREMLRVAPRVFLAESLPSATTEAQRAHLAMYELREEVFAATTGHRDDLRYLPLDRLAALVERAGGRVMSSITTTIDLPHALAFFPRDLVESIPDMSLREQLLDRWESASSMRASVGEDHPPVGIISAQRS